MVVHVRQWPRMGGGGNTGLQKQALSKNKAGMEQETSMTDKHDCMASLVSTSIKFNKNNEARVKKIGSLPEPSWRRPDHSLHMSQVHEETI